MARPSCLDCSRKHASTAEVLMNEAKLGYPLFAWYAVGHLVQAEEELLTDFPEEAEFIRSERVKYIDGLIYTEKDGEIILNARYNIDTMIILRRLTSIAILNGKDNLDKVKDVPSKRKRK